jgi:signal transduction histidine kinase
MKILSDAILIQEDVDTGLYKEFLQDINSEIDRMTYIINDLLKVVKLDQGETGLNIENIDLYKMVTDILKRLFPIAEQKQIKIVLNEVKQKILADVDEVKMTLAISNLIENAIKYTNPEGIVKISLEQDHMHAFISVQDSGIGISESDQTKVFDRFYRVDKTRDRETGGTGLGLSITHSTILLHNGSIKLTSKPEEGSTFLIRVPLQHSQASKTFKP